MLFDKKKDEEGRAKVITDTTDEATVMAGDGARLGHGPKCQLISDGNV